MNWNIYSIRDESASRTIAICEMQMEVWREGVGLHFVLPLFFKVSDKM